MRQAQFTTLAVHLALVLSALLAVSPFAYLAIGSLQNPVDSSLSFNNFRALGDLRILRWLTNSLFVASAHTVLVVILSSLGGFALAKYRFRGQFAIQGLMVATMLIPSQLIVPGLYDIVLGLGWADRFVAVIVPSMVSAFGILLFRQAFIQIPDELLDAARLDGAGELWIWWAIALPGVRPMIGAYTLMSFLGSWNSFLWPQMILQSDSKFTLPMGLSNLTGLTEYAANPGILLAATLVSILPPAVLFFALHAEFLESIRVRPDLLGRRRIWPNRRTKS